MPSASLWNACLHFFEKKLPIQQFNSWIKPLEIEVIDDQIILTAPNAFALKLVQDRFLSDISRIAETQLNLVPKLDLRVKAKKSTEPEKDTPLDLPVSTPAPAIPLPSKKAPLNRLNPLLTFENYVTGKANQFAHAAAIQVADSLGSAYNPLFIYGGVGMGKTHLLQAIGNQVLANNEHAKIRYIHATDYVSEWVRAVQTKKFEEFKQSYNSLDLLMVDDIQFIADKISSQQEFFYTLNTLTECHRQVVITSDTFPKDISGIEPRLTSRFSWGLTVAIDPPNVEMRVAILLQKAKQINLPMDETTAFFIAKHVRSNIRELEGALKRIAAFSKFHKRPISVELAKEALKDLLTSQKKQVSVENIQKTVADFYHIKLIDLLSKKRVRAISRPRQVAMYLSRELTQLSLPEIGAAFGGRDHTTVLHACKTIEEIRGSSASFSSELSMMYQILRN